MSFPFWPFNRTRTGTGSPVSVRAKPALIIAGIILFGLAVVVISSGRTAAVAVLIALAITLTSAVVGFLFGIPRSVGSDGGDSPPPSAAPTSAGVKPVAPNRTRNGSLEQIADWLTKLMLGAGLTQLTEIKRAIHSLALTIASCYRPFGSSGPYPESLVFGLAVVGFFTACGFLGGYLSTRLLLARLFTEEDLDIDRLQNQIEKDVNQHKLDIQQSAIDHAAAADPLVKAAIAGAEAWQPPTGETVADDPQKGRFGGKSEASGRRLSASVKAPNESASELFQIVLTVDSLPGVAALTEPVKFFLHYTFPQKTIVVPPASGVARLDLVGWGAFTVGAITDGGKTLLELDLATLPDAPQKFRER